VISHGKQMSDERLTSVLAVRAMHWRLAPGRYLKPDRGWTSRSGFCPLVDLKDAFQALESVTKDYSLDSRPSGIYTVRLRFEGRLAQGAGATKARAICLALADALGIDPEVDG
jgi:hypothetical protein